MLFGLREQRRALSGAPRVRRYGTEIIEKGRTVIGRIG